MAEAWQIKHAGDNGGLESVRATLQQAFAAWTRRFEYVSGAYMTILSLQGANQPADAALLNLYGEPRSA